MEYFANDLGLPHYGSLEPCWLCSCSARPDSCHPWTDLRSPAAWESTIIDAEEGIATDFTHHPIGKLECVTRFHASGDMMHTCCLGVAQNMMGSILNELVFQGPFLGSKDLRVEQVFKLIKKHYDKLNTSSRLGNLTITMFTRKDQWSELHSKDAESQQLLFAIQYVLQELHDGSEHHEHRLRCVCSLVRIYQAFKDGDMFLPRHVAESALEDLRTMYAHWHWLLSMSVEVGALNWGLKPKLHYMFHIVWHSRFLNPRFTWCYEWEDHMRSVVMAAKACIAGSPMHLVGCKVIQNARLVLEITLEW